jgi:heptosyltransferase-2
MKNPKSILVIQTAFIGDVILATSVLEKLHLAHPEAKIEIVVRKGNEALLNHHPFLHKVHVWDKKNGKYKNLRKLIAELRKQEYDVCINLQRFAASGWMTFRCRAKYKAGFRQNPFHFCYHHKVKHSVNEKEHEILRNQKVIDPIAPGTPLKPKLYPTDKDYSTVAGFKTLPYFTISPASVWFTKQYPSQNWIELIKKLPAYSPVFLIGGPDDVSLCDTIARASGAGNIHNTAGKLSLTETSALMQHAQMNFTNDSAPMHIASAMNAPVTAIFCSTIPGFGFTPLSDISIIAETQEQLSCRPCGLHGHDRCPKGHFRCSEINQEVLLKSVFG